MPTTVSLEDNEWSYLLGVLGERPWREVNTVLMKIGAQLRMQQPGSVGVPRANGGFNAAADDEPEGRKDEPRAERAERRTPGS